MSELPAPEAPDLLERLACFRGEDIDALPFGVVGIDETDRVRVYNRFEAELAEREPREVIGLDFFRDVAPCADTFLVAGRLRREPAVDEWVPYVFSYRMPRTRVRLRLLKGPAAPLRYLVVTPVDDDAGGRRT